MAFALHKSCLAGSACIQCLYITAACHSTLSKFGVQAVNETNAPQLPVLLATKLLPEMEAQHLHLQARHAADAGHLNLIDQIARTDVSSHTQNAEIPLSDMRTLGASKLL